MMKHANTLLLAAMLGVAAISTGCAVARDQSTVGGYVDDKVITTKVKAKLIEDKSTGGMSINVDTLNGTVALSGFAKTEAEKAAAGRIARSTEGVKDVRNNLIVRP